MRVDSLLPLPALPGGRRSGGGPGRRPRRRSGRRPLRPLQLHRTGRLLSGPGRGGRGGRGGAAGRRPHGALDPGRVGRHPGVDAGRGGAAEDAERDDAHHVLHAVGGVLREHLQRPARVPLQHAVASEHRTLAVAKHDQVQERVPPSRHTWHASLPVLEPAHSCVGLMPSGSLLPGMRVDAVKALLHVSCGVTCRRALSSMELSWSSAKSSTPQPDTVTLSPSRSRSPPAVCRQAGRTYSLSTAGRCSLSSAMSWYLDREGAAW